MKNKKGFTLIELLIVIAIIGILASIVLVSLNSARTKANYASFKATMSSIQPQAIICLDSSVALNAAGAAQATGTTAMEICPLTTGADGNWPELPAGCTNRTYSGVTSVVATGTFSYTATCVTGACTMTCTETGCTPTGC